MASSATRPGAAARVGVRAHLQDKVPVPIATSMISAKRRTIGRSMSRIRRRHRKNGQWHPAFVKVARFRVFVSESASPWVPHGSSRASRRTDHIFTRRLSNSS
jgi:hypothetical protein